MSQAMLLWAQSTHHAVPQGYGSALLQATIALAAVCLLAWLVLRFVARRGFGAATEGRLQVLERVPLDARRSLVLVQVGSRAFLVGTGDGAAPRLIAEFSSDALPSVPPKPRPSFRDVLSGLGPRE